MYETIKNFASQFAFVPQIVHGEKLSRYRHYIVAGMGGSGLAAGLVRRWNPVLDVYLHQNYGLPKIAENTLIVASSYSGNTEEVLDAFHEALIRKLPCAVIAAGGQLLEKARENIIPYIQLPNTGIQPRSARGYSFMALLKLLGEERALAGAARLAQTLDPLQYQEDGEALAGRLKGMIPVIYASERNVALAYNWKITFNETGKVPAFYNVFPELNHNEMAGFDDKDLSRSFHFIFLKDLDDDPKTQKRMSVLERLFHDRGFRIEIVEVCGENVFQRIFSSLLIADWVAYHLAGLYGHEPEKMPIVEEFKKLL